MGRSETLFTLSVKRFAISVVKNSLLLLALALSAGLSALFTMRAVLSAQEVQVPSLLDRRLPEASAQAARSLLLVKVEGRRNDPKVAPGHVAAQEPAAGSTLKTHRSIRVWLSAGPQRLRVPALAGESLRSARLMLEQAQLPVEHVVEVDHPEPEGTVLAQQPPAGEAEEVLGPVALLVSRGPANVDYVMPDLIGRRAEDVFEGLRRAGLKLADVRYRSYPGVAPGIVLRQSPAAGHRVSPRSSVSLDVSKAS